MREGIFPTALKTAKIIPIYKKGERDDLINYRPISLLSNVSKVFEKIIFNRLYKFIDKYGILDSMQFGFRPKHSTVDAVTLLVSDILKPLNNKDSVIAVFCDLSRPLTLWTMVFCFIS